MNSYNPNYRSCATPPECRNTSDCRADKPHCHQKPRFPASTAYAMAYVPFQQSGEVYSCEKALSRGTIFPCLDKPFLKGCCK